MKEDPWKKGSKFHYRGNSYNILNHNDLAKLYLQQDHMVRFLSVADDSCDPSAILNLMALASCFTPEEAKKANTVRKEVRNQWAHCNLSSYTESYMEDVFRHLESIADVLPSKEHIRRQLKQWRIHGFQLIQGSAEKVGKGCESYQMFCYKSRILFFK